MFRLWAKADEWFWKRLCAALVTGHHISLVARARNEPQHSLVQTSQSVPSRVASWRTSPKPQTAEPYRRDSPNRQHGGTTTRESGPSRSALHLPQAQSLATCLLRFEFAHTPGRPFSPVAAGPTKPVHEVDMACITSMRRTGHRVTLQPRVWCCVVGCTKSIRSCFLAMAIRMSVSGCSSASRIE